jgi:lipoprotein-releasing system ATP-binding protein
MISIKGVAKRFPNERDINYKDMNFEDGKSYMLLGASGCGKSTLLNMIAGILSPESGEILIDGTDMTKKSQKEKDKFRIKNIGYIFQDFKLIPEMTVIDNINILRLERVDTSRADEILGKLGMLEKKNKKIKHLSGGEKQRVAIARAIVKLPDIILADEPTGNLDTTNRDEIQRLLMDVRDRFDQTIVMVTHDMGLADSVDRKIVMSDGCIL